MISPYSVKSLNRGVIVVGLLLIVSPLFSQPGPPPPNPVPIQGLPFLIIAGLIYGVFKTLRRNSRAGKP